MSGGESIEEMFLCSDHSKRYKEYSCLACNKAICLDCLTIGAHKGHDGGTIENGYKKVAGELKNKSSEYEKLFKESGSRLGLTLTYLNEEKGKIIKEFQNFIDEIEKQREEKREIIEAEIEKFAERNMALEKCNLKLMKVLTHYEASKKTPGQEDYHKFIKDSEELEEAKNAFDKLTSDVSIEKEKYATPSLESTRRYAIDLRKYKESLPKNLPKAPEELLADATIYKNIQDKELLLSWISEAYNNAMFNLKLLWKGSIDGFAAGMFHGKCNDQGPTVTVVLATTNYVFGGFTKQSWKGNDVYVHDPEAFIFSLNHKTKHNKQKNNNSIHTHPNYGPTFGGGQDIYICDKCNANNNNYSNSNSTYELPSDTDGKVYFAGAPNFTVKEIEVYAVIAN